MCERDLMRIGQGYELLDQECTAVSLLPAALGLLSRLFL